MHQFKLPHFHEIDKGRKLERFALLDCVGGHGGERTNGRQPAFSDCGPFHVVPNHAVLPSYAQNQAAL